MRKKGGDQWVFEWEYQRDNRRNGHMDVLMGVPERQQEKWTHGCFNGSTGETTLRQFKPPIFPE